ncbi:preprotein translocase subunit YajC [Pedobacter changchengzhani]|uniref:Sec translocon accessory complex subunit YajC n=1 Tax=Pedobacter changchengzhani TaxID=2529274 RepID=A0A4R5MKD1_9SPHI|nr:preprotein translocase subunit YajC [Pedobacter changchengzhani]TDG36038.1 preprotein translocase subunit YajC [Pedobacter changchengzhani]
MTTTIILQAAAGGFDPKMLIMMGAIVIVFYFFMIRPQVKKAKDHKKLVDDLKKGDKIVTTAGIHGRIFDSNDTTFLIEVEGGTKIRFDKTAVSLDATKALAPKA